MGIRRLKALMAAKPVLDSAARSLTRIPVVKELLALRHRFRDSSSYWERRYRQGGTSSPCQCATAYLKIRNASFCCRFDARAESATRHIFCRTVFVAL